MNKSKIIGSMLIIAGTTIGAGMLALPLAASGLGFGVASLIMILIWSLMTYTALLMIEVHQSAPVDATLHTLAYQYLGRKGQLLASFAMMFLFYALCAAYIAGGGEQLHTKLTAWFGDEVPIQLGAIIFTALIASVVSFGTRSVDIINRGLFTLKLIALVLMLTLLLPNIKLENLTELPMHQGLVLASLPVIFTSFGFHGSIPSVVRYLDKDIKALRWVVLVGSALPLVVYLFWLLGSQGVLPQAQLVDSKSLNGFIASLSQALHNPMITNAVSVFADLALATSFLGVSLGLSDFMADLLQRQKSADASKRQNFSYGLQTALVTFVPPLVFALFYPQGFITALGYAAFALVILAVFLPVAMVVSMRRQAQLEEGDAIYRVAGGKLGLVIATLAGVLIMLVQLLIMFNVLSFA